MAGDAEPAPEGFAMGEWCFIHQRREPWVAGESYRSCFECGHVYGSAAELQRTELELWGVVTPNPDKIWVCPLCTHDF